MSMTPETALGRLKEIAEQMEALDPLPRWKSPEVRAIRSLAKIMKWMLELQVEECKHRQR